MFFWANDDLSSTVGLKGVSIGKKTDPTQASSGGCRSDTSLDTLGRDNCP